MSKRLEVVSNYLIITDTIDLTTREYPKARVRYRDTNENIEFRYIDDTSQNITYQFSELVDENDNAWADIPTLLEWLRVNTGGAKVSGSGGLDVNIQDQTTPSFDLYFTQATGVPTTLSQDTGLDSYTIVVNDVTNFVVGTFVGVFSGTGRFYWGEVIGVNGNTLTMDRPTDFNFLTGSNVLPTTKNLNVDGSVTPQIFSIQAGSTGLEIDITRIILSIVCTNPIELNLFGDQPALTRGIQLRKIDGTYRNYLNAKTNYEIGIHTYDIKIFEQVKQNDVNALIARSTFAGQSKRGVTVRIGAGEELQLIVQDDLTGIIAMLAMAQGHEVD
jgi:hypothetical protein